MLGYANILIAVLDLSFVIFQDSVEDVHIAGLSVCGNYGSI